MSDGKGIGEGDKGKRCNMRNKKEVRKSRNESLRIIGRSNRE